MIDRILNKTHLKVPKELSFDFQNEERRIKLTNYISLISLFSDFIFIFYYSLIGFKELRTIIIILAIISPIYLTPIFLNKIKYHLAAKLLIASFTSILTVFFSLYYFGSKPGIHIFLLFFGITPIFLWSSKQLFFPITLFSLSLLSFIYIEFFHSPIYLHLNFPVEHLAFTRGFSVLISFLGATAAIVVFHRLANIKEKLLHTQNEKIGQQKELLLKLNEELNEKVEKLTLQQEELNQSNIVKNKINSVIAHDLRSPFSSINGLLGVILEDFNELDNTQIKGYISSIYITSQNTLTLLENLLDWSRMQSGKIKLSPEKICLTSIIEEVISINRTFFEKKDIILSNNIDNSFLVYADKYMLSTVLRNIISNAIKFTPKNGEITINARTSKENKIELNISDTGIGMTSSEIKKLFNVEENFTKQGTDNEKGTGLGLLICKEFIEKNGGEFHVKSIPEKGSSFYFSLNQII